VLKNDSAVRAVMTCKCVKGRYSNRITHIELNSPGKLDRLLNKFNRRTMKIICSPAGMIVMGAVAAWCFAKWAGWI